MYMFSHRDGMNPFCLNINLLSMQLTKLIAYPHFIAYTCKYIIKSNCPTPYTYKFINLVITNELNCYQFKG